MKTFLTALGLVFAGLTLANAQPADNELKAETVRRAEEDLVAPKTEKNNQVSGRKVIYSGVAVAAAKAENKLQLLSPWAPDEYGSAEDSVVRDPITRAVSGIKIFSIKF